MLVNPAVNAVKGAMAVGKSGAEAKMARRQAVDAVGQIVAQAVAYNVIAGVGDKLTQDLTGDKNARMAAWGPFAYIRLIDDLAHGRLNTPYDWAKAATAGLLAPSPFAGILLAAFQKNFNFTDMHVKKGQSKLEKQMGTIAKDVFPPGGMLKDAFDNPLKEGLNQLTGVGKTPNAQKYKR
jgi:hypothetical protein